MPLSLFTSVGSVGWKCHVMVCYCTSLPTSACSKSVKLTMMAVFILQANTANQGVFPPESQALNMCQHTTVQGWTLVLVVPSEVCWYPEGPGAQLGDLVSSPNTTPLLPQGFVLLPKTECDVREVEFARCLRLRQTSLEPVSFRLPRVRVRLRANI